MPQEKNQRLSLCVALALIVMGGSYLTSRASYRGTSPTSQSPSPSQSKGTRSYPEHADLLTYDAALQQGVQRLEGRCVLRHGNADYDL